MRHVPWHDEEFHHIKIEGAIEGLKPSERERNSYITQLKKLRE